MAGVQAGASKPFLKVHSALYTKTLTIFLGIRRLHPLPSTSTVAIETRGATDGVTTDSTSRNRCSRGSLTSECRVYNTKRGSRGATKS